MDKKLRAKSLSTLRWSRRLSASFRNRLNLIIRLVHLRRLHPRSAATIQFDSQLIIKRH